MAGEPSKGGDRGNTPASDPRHRVLTAKLPPELIDALGEEARSRGVTRNALVRQALERVLTEGTSVPDHERRMARAVARMAEERALTRRLEAQGVLRAGRMK